MLKSSELASGRHLLQYVTCGAAIRGFAGPFSDFVASVSVLCLLCLLIIADQLCLLANRCRFTLPLLPPRQAADGFRSSFQVSSLPVSISTEFFSVTVLVSGCFRVVPISRVAMDTSSLLAAFGHPLTLWAPAPKLIISDEFNRLCLFFLILQSSD